MIICTYVSNEQIVWLSNQLDKLKRITNEKWASMPMPEFYFDLHGTDAGVCIGHTMCRINPSLFDLPNELGETLAHEMAHAVVDYLRSLGDHRAMIDRGHGMLWREVMESFGYPNAQISHYLSPHLLAAYSVPRFAPDYFDDFVAAA